MITNIILTTIDNNLIRNNNFLEYLQTFSVVSQDGHQINTVYECRACVWVITECMQEHAYTVLNVIT